MKIFKEDFFSIIIIIFLIWAITLFILIFNKKVKTLENYEIIYNKGKNTQEYYLYSDSKRKYFLKGYRTEDVYIVKSDDNIVNKKILKEAKENL